MGTKSILALTLTLASLGFGLAILQPHLRNSESGKQAENYSPETEQIKVPVLDEYLRKNFRECRNNKRTCVITSNDGGIEGEFLSAAEEVLAGARDIIMIDGPCASACAVFADKAKAKVCITHRAVFHFHMARLYKDNKLKKFIGWAEPEQSPPIRAWVIARKGFPKSRTKMLDMPATEAARFWHLCEINPPLIGP